MARRRARPTKLGKLCKHGHDHEDTGQSLRYDRPGQLGPCTVCARTSAKRGWRAGMERPVTRAHTISVRRLTKDEIAIGALLWPERPRLPVARGECRGTPRPCPHVSCRFHLFLDVSRHGNIKHNFPDREPWEMQHSCALDVADEGPHTLEEVGSLLNVTRERLRQIEVAALAKLEARGRELLAETLHERTVHLTIWQRMVSE